MGMTREALLERLRTTLVETFHLAPEDVVPEAHLYQDLGLDSIDAVEMAIQLQQLTGSRLKPEAFKAVRTVQDVVDVLHAMLKEQ